MLVTPCWKPPAECRGRISHEVGEAAKANDRLGRLMVLAEVAISCLVEHLSDADEYARICFVPWSNGWLKRQGVPQKISDSSLSSSESSDSSNSSFEEEEQSHALIASANETVAASAPSSQCDTVRVFRRSRTRMLAKRQDRLWSVVV